MAKSKREDRIDYKRAAELLESEWKLVAAEAEQNPTISFITNRSLRKAIANSVNHPLVLYRYCLPIQLLGKLCNPKLDALALQRGKDPTDATSWNARSLGSNVVAKFIHRQEDVLGISRDPYVGNPGRIPRMQRDDKSKKDVPGWNVLIDVLGAIESRADPQFTEQAFRQVLLEIYRRQQTLRFSYPVPPRISLEAALNCAQKFLSEKSGGDRALALAGALFDVIGSHFRLFAQVNRGKINVSDEAAGRAADLECVDSGGNIVIAVEVKDRELSLSDFEGTISKARNRDIKEVFFTAPRVAAKDAAQIAARTSTSFAGGQNFYVFDFFELAKPVLALGGEKMRVLFLKMVGEHLNTWNTQPSHRQAWKQILESL